MLCLHSIWITCSYMIAFWFFHVDMRRGILYSLLVMHKAIVCITRGSRVPESRFSPRTPSQTRPNLPGDPNPKPSPGVLYPRRALLLLAGGTSSASPTSFRANHRPLPQGQPQSIKSIKSVPVTAFHEVYANSGATNLRQAREAKSPRNPLVSHDLPPVPGTPPASCGLLGALAEHSVKSVKSVESIKSVPVTSFHEVNVNPGATNLRRAREAKTQPNPLISHNLPHGTATTPTRPTRPTIATLDLGISLVISAWTLVIPPLTH